MKLSVLACSLLVASFGASAVIIDRDATDTKDITFSGTVPPMCRVDTKERAVINNLDLTSNRTQAIADVLVWCNTASRDADVTYSSANNGSMVDEHNHRIDYVIDLGNEARNIALTKAGIKLLQHSGRNNEHARAQGDAISTTLSISPLVTAYEYAGTYTDTITVDVAARH